jgi:inorganic pyrophosphatase
MLAQGYPTLTPVFWNFIDRLVAESQVMIERAKDSHHPRFAGMIYPLDYGYLANTSSPDGREVDVWIGTQDPNRVVGVLLTIDLGKRDIEMKLLLGCTTAEMAQILAWTNSDQMQAALVPRVEEQNVR